MAAKYPHMMPREIPIWERFLAKYGDKFLGFEYDVHLGKGIARDPSWPDWLWKVVQATSRKRADAVGETDREIWIFEVKPRVGFSAVGQLLGYGVLLLEEWRPRKPIRLAAVCERTAPDIEPILREFGIELFIV